MKKGRKPTICLVVCAMLALPLYGMARAAEVTPVPTEGKVTVTRVHEDQTAAENEPPAAEEEQAFAGQEESPAGSEADQLPAEENNSLQEEVQEEPQEAQVQPGQEQTVEEPGQDPNTEGQPVPEEITEDADRNIQIESTTVSTTSTEKPIISVAVPTIGEISPFDFYIDPENFLYQIWSASENHDQAVEEGVHLLFRNRSREGYIFSSVSDFLTVTNRSTVPVRVTITAAAENIDNLTMAQDKDFPEGNDCLIYMAIVDDEENEVPLSEEGTVALTVELSQADRNAYNYEYDEETGEYHYAWQNHPEKYLFDSFSFGLTGEVNADGDWGRLLSQPKVNVKWQVEPIMEEEENRVEGNEGKTVSDTVLEVAQD